MRLAARIFYSLSNEPHDGPGAPRARPTGAERAQGQLAKTRMSGIMSDMRSSITVRELQKDLKRVLARVERGQTLQVTRHRRPVAVLAPPRPAATQPWPDLEERARAVLGDRVVSPSPTELVIRERGDR